MKWLALLLAAGSVFAVAKTDAPRWEVRDELATVLAEHGAIGTIVVLDEADETWHVTNRDRAQALRVPIAFGATTSTLSARDQILLLPKAADAKASGATKDVSWAIGRVDGLRYAINVDGAKNLDAIARDALGIVRD